MIAGLRIAFVLAAFLALTLALLPVQLIALGIGHSVMRRLPRWWHRMMCRIIGLRVRVRGGPSPERPLLMVANHVSWKDILVLGSVADVVFIAKSEVRGCSARCSSSARSGARPATRYPKSQAGCWRGKWWCCSPRGPRRTATG